MCNYRTVRCSIRDTANMKIKAASIDMPQIVEEMFWLAYQASRVVGMGILQARNDATKADVLASLATVYGNGLHADYVYGRMMKLLIRLSDDGKQIEVPDMVPMYDYQSWCFRYPTYDDLFNAAFASYKKVTA